MMAAAKDMDDAEFWLPSDFLTDDFFAGEEKQNDPESDEDDAVSGLTHQMKSHSFFNEESKSSILKGENPKPSVMATSPQSTLCGVGSWSFSSSGSPDGPSQVSSPPSTPFQQPRDDALDLLYAAAGQVERLGLGNETAAARGLLAPPQEHSCHIPAANKHNMGFSSNQNLIQQQLQAARFYQLKRQQLLKQQQQFAAAWARQQQSRAKAGARPLDLSNSAWPPLQKQQQQQQQPQQQQAPAGSGMTAVFLNGDRRQSNGTGVFLPRRPGTTSEPRKKQACSTVLLPARVVQALNLNLEDMSIHPRLPGCYVLDNDALMARSNLKKNQPAAAPTAASPEIRLPQEWTY